MAIREDTVDVQDEIILLQAWVDTVGGYTKAEIVTGDYMGEEWLQEQQAAGWTLTRYRKVEDDG